MVIVIAPSAVYYWLTSKSGKTKYHNNGIPCFFLKHAATKSDLNLRQIKLIKQVNVIFHTYIVDKGVIKVYIVYMFKLHEGIFHI